MGTPVLHRPVLVLNREWLPIAVTNVKQAILLMFTRYEDTGEPKSRVLNLSDLSVHDTTSKWAVSRRVDAITHSDTSFIFTPMHRVRVPQAIVLSRFSNYAPVNQQWYGNFNRYAMFDRDGYRCAYCGASEKDGVKLTVDHILPQSQGGESSFKNCVTACEHCNIVKGSRSLQAAGMRLRSGISLNPPSLQQVQRNHLRRYQEKFQLLLRQQSGVQL